MFYADPKGVSTLAKLSFPDYHGKKFKIVTLTGPITIASYWSGGSRDYWTFIRIEDMEVKSLPIELGNPFVGPARETEIPRGYMAVKHSYYCGKDMGLTFYAHPENVTRFLPEKADLSQAEKIVLCATRSLKSSYGGVSDYRYREARRETGIARVAWDIAVESLISRGFLDKRKAITVDGRNAIGNVQLYQLKG